MSIPYAASAENWYVTDNVSPLTTDRLPGDPKLDTENNTPLVPVATLVKKAPATVTVPFMENCEGAAVLLMTEGSAVVAAPNVTALRLPE
jgi:hypothetical protein